MILCSLDELEAEAPPLVEAVWAVSNSPLAHVTGKGVTAAAQVRTLACLTRVHRAAPGLLQCWFIPGVDKLRRWEKRRF